MKVRPRSLECILPERYSFYFCIPSNGIGGNLAFKIAVEKFIYYIQKFIWLAVTLILMFHIAFVFVVVDAKIATKF